MQAYHNYSKVSAILMTAKGTVEAWDLSETYRLIEHPAVRLLRGQNAGFTLTFLHRAFKEHHEISVPESHLRARLENFLGEARSQYPDKYSQSAGDYLNAWCGTEQLLLKKFYSADAEEPVFELTSAAEKAMQWIEDLHAKAFIGAESRLELIFRHLEEIVLFSTTDAERRVAALREQQATLQAEIDSIQSSNTAPAYTPVQLTERFANALDLARGLAGDFRQLEENFKEVARALAEAQTQPGATKGRIVGQLLDTHAALKNSSQGQSFYAFWNLLSSPARQERWRELTRTVYRVEAIDPALRSNTLLERLSNRLLVEGERVVRSNERMAATLRRALESVATGEERRLRELIREIQQAAITCQSAPPIEDNFFELDGGPVPFGSFSRSLWEPNPVGSVDGSFSFANNEVNLDVLSRFRALANLSLNRLRDQLRACLVSADSILLSEVLERFPPSDGVLEVVGYLIIAAQEREHYVAVDQYSTIAIGEGDCKELWRVPQILFARSA